MQADNNLVVDGTIKDGSGVEYLKSYGWIPVSDTWTYASATTITVPSGATSKYKVGQGVKLTQSGTVKYFYIVGVTNTLLYHRWNTCQCDNFRYQLYEYTWTGVSYHTAYIDQLGWG